MYVRKSRIPYDLLEKSKSSFDTIFLENIIYDSSCTRLLFYMGCSKNKNELIGYCVFRYINKKLFLYILYVEPKLRGCGYGKMILNYLEKNYEHIIVPSLRNIINFYKLNGFTQTDKYKYLSEIIIEEGIVLEKNVSRNKCTL
jgi:GNAT superfamily N-acetyltransferase